MLVEFEDFGKIISDQYKKNLLHHANIIESRTKIDLENFLNDAIISDLNIKENTLFISKDKDKKEITIDKIANIKNFINSTRINFGSSFIVIDSLCLLNKNASNALLKILEEPGANRFFFLICHNIDKVTPTVISRCKIIKIKNFNFTQFSSKLLKKKLFNDDELEFLSIIFDNCYINAFENGENYINFYKLFLSSLDQKLLDPKLFKLIENFTINDLKKIIIFFINRFSTYKIVKKNLLFDEEQIFKNLKLYNQQRNKDQFYLLSNDNNLFEKINAIFTEAQIYNLDKKTSLINIFNMICYG